MDRLKDEGIYIERNHNFSTKENLFQFTPGLSEKKIFEMSIQQNNPNIKDKK